MEQTDISKYFGKRQTTATAPVTPTKGSTKSRSGHRTQERLKESAVTDEEEDGSTVVTEETSSKIQIKAVQK